MARDAVTLIMQDHRVMEALFEQAKNASTDRPALVTEIEARLIAHSKAEETFVYPELTQADASEAGKVHHGVHEHQEAEELLWKLKETKPESSDFDNALQKFVDAVTHHVEEEERVILPALKQAVSEEKLIELGEAFDKARQDHLHGFGFATASSQAEKTKAELYEQAKEAGVPGRSQMTKDELAQALADPKTK